MDQVSSAFAEPFGSWRVLEQAHDRGGNGRGVAVGHEQPAGGVGDDFIDAARGGCDHGASAGERFEHGHAEPFHPAWQHADLGGVVELGHQLSRYAVGGQDRVSDLEAACLRQQVGAVGAVVEGAVSTSRTAGALARIAGSAWMANSMPLRGASRAAIILEGVVGKIEQARILFMLRDAARRLHKALLATGHLRN